METPAEEGRQSWRFGVGDGVGDAQSHTKSGDYMNMLTICDLGMRHIQTW